MRNKKSLLLIEDEKVEVRRWHEWLKRKGKYEYKLTVAMSPQECIKKHIDKKRFDVAVVDLKLSEGKRECFFGVKVVTALASVFPDMPIVVCSAYSDAANVVDSIHRGATTFVDKKYSGEKAVAMVESTIDEWLTSSKKKEQLDNLLAKYGKKWKEKYPGKVIALVRNKVVAVGDSYLHTAVNYDKLLLKHKNWPKDPDDIIEIEQ